MTEKRFEPHLFDDEVNERYYDGIIDNEDDTDVIVNYQYICNLLNNLHEENQLLKQRLAEQNDVEWLRNNTVWEMMPSSYRTYISTIYHRRNEE